MEGLGERDARAWRGLLLVQQLSGELSAIGYEVLGTAATDNRAIQLLALLLDGPMASKDVAAALGMPTPAAYKLLRGLDAEAMIQRTQDPRDGRRYDISLTARGRRRLESFEARLTAYCAGHDGLLTQIADLLGDADSRRIPSVAPRPVLVMAALGTAGAAYLDAVGPILHRYQLQDASTRFALCRIAASGPIRPRVLAQELGMTAGGVTALLDRLEAAGHTTRRHDPDSGDRRTVLVGVTPQGARAASEVLDVFAGLGPEFARTASIARSLTPTHARSRATTGRK